MNKIEIIETFSNKISKLCDISKSDLDYDKIREDFEKRPNIIKKIEENLGEFDVLDEKYKDGVNKILIKNDIVNQFAIENLLKYVKNIKKIKNENIKQLIKENSEKISYHRELHNKIDLLSEQVESYKKLLNKAKKELEKCKILKDDEIKMLKDEIKLLSLNHSENNLFSNKQMVKKLKRNILF